MEQGLVEGLENAHGIRVAERVRQALVHGVEPLDFVQGGVPGRGEPLDLIDAAFGQGGVLREAAVGRHPEGGGRGLREKYDPAQHDFALPADFVAALDRYDGPVNFLTDNDITGGNSGSPVLNARGELIGLAFDGNKESLASDVSFTPDYNKCVCVDIRYVLWILKDYVGLERIVKEIE